MRQITVKIKNGEIFTNFKGFEGKKCDAVAEEIEEKLNDKGLKVKIEDKEYKPEYYMEINSINEEDIRENELNIGLNG